MKSHAATSISLSQAKKIAQHAEERAAAIGVPMVIAIVDAGGNLVLHERMENSLQVSINIALNKAYTAIALKMPSDKLTPLVQPGAPLYGIQHSDARLIVFGGGFPIVEKGSVIGGLGISGGSVEQDMAVAEYALEQSR